MTEQTEPATVARPSSSDVLDTPEAGPMAIRGGALRVAGYAATAVIGTGSAAILFRHLGVVDTGAYVTVVSAMAIVAAVSDVGLTTVGMRELTVRSGADRAQLMRDLLGLRVAMTTAGVAIAIGLLAVAGYSGLLLLGLLIAGVGLLVQSLQTTLAISLMSQLRLGWVTIAEVGRQAVAGTLVVGFALAGAGLLTFIAIPIPVGLALLVLTAVLVRRDVPLLPAFNRERWWALIRDILPYSIAVAAAALYFRAAVIIVSLTASAEQLGYFGASFRVLEVLVMIPTLMVSAAFPILARSARDDAGRFDYALGRVLDVSIVTGVWFALVLGLGATLAIQIIGGAKFAPAAEILRIQAIGLGMSFVAVVWSTALLSLSRHREIMRLNLTAMVVGAATVLTMTLLDGARGAAISIVATEFLLAVGGAWLYVRTTGAALPSLRVLPRALAAGAVAAAVALGSGLPTVPTLIVVTVVYVLGLVVLRAIPREIAEALLQRFRAPA